MSVAEQTQVAGAQSPAAAARLRASRRIGARFLLGFALPVALAVGCEIAVRTGFAEGG
jgi:hypothetical protein